MAFFDDLGKKISQAGQSAVQKTKDMTDIARINSAISDEEKKVSNNYHQLGVLYVAKHPADYESDFAELIAGIKASEGKISDYKQQIQNIKGVTRCEKCGAEVSNNAAFCAACGAPVPKPAQSEPEVAYCPACGAMVAKNAKFCAACGTPMPNQQ